MELSIFKSKVSDGIMSEDKVYFSDLKKEEIKALHKEVLERFLSSKGINKNIIILDSNCKELKKKNVTAKTTKIKEAILLLKEVNNDVLIGVESEDDPVIIASATDEKDKKVAAISLGTIENLSNGLLNEMVEILMKETNKAPFEMTFYIGACPSKDNYILEDIKDINQKDWGKYIEEKNKKYHIDIRYYIFDKLIQQIVDPNFMYFDSVDTVTNPDCFSKFKSTRGKNITCITYTE